MFAYDVFSLTSDLCLQYTPILGKCANRSEIWRSLKKGEMDLSFQLESAEFYAQGLTFMPLFYVPEYECTFGELAPEVKNRISHRARALGRLRDVLKDKI